MAGRFVFGDIWSFSPKWFKINVGIGGDLSTLSEEHRERRYLFFWYIFGTFLGKIMPKSTKIESNMLQKGLAGVLYTLHVKYAFCGGEALSDPQFEAPLSRIARSAIGVHQSGGRQAFRLYEMQICKAKTKMDPRAARATKN